MLLAAALWVVAGPGAVAAATATATATATAASAATAGAGAGAGAGAQGGGGPAGTWQPPLAGPPQVSRGYDPPATRYGAGHRGVDLAGRAGNAVLAAGAGRVTYAGLLAGRGVVVVEHGELRTTYEPVSADVAVGDQVGQGQPLGTLGPGHDGCSSAACLHWGLRRGEAYLDPMSLLGPVALRLLPLGAPALPPVAAREADQRPAPAAAAPARTRPVAAGRPAGIGPPPGEPEAPWLSLRAAEAPMGALAIGALVAGLGLLRRPGGPPPHPSEPAPGLQRERGGAVPAAASPQLNPLPPPVDLLAERERRRAA